jgi:hypothetical protein
MLEWLQVMHWPHAAMMEHGDCGTPPQVPTSLSRRGTVGQCTALRSIQMAPYVAQGALMLLLVCGTAAQAEVSSRSKAILMVF